LEETLEADNPIWHKTGHFYFALTESSGCEADHFGWAAAIEGTPLNTDKRRRDF
jgi:hypothetical protein